jgi:hypothetical protein
MQEIMMRPFFVLASDAIFGISNQFKPKIRSAVVTSTHARCKGKFSTYTPPMKAPIMLPTKPPHPNHSGKTPSKIIGR